jgi:signal transduction histidine kinase
VSALDATARSLGERVGERISERVTVGAAQTIVMASIIPVSASAIWLALTSGHVEHPVATALYYSYLAVAPMLIGLYWWRRRPASLFGPLLVAFGIVAWVVSWQSANWPLVFDLGVLGDAPLTFLTFYLLLAFPSGRLESVADRFLMGGWAVVLGGFFLPWALGSPVIEGGGPLAACVPACPKNVLQVGSAPGLVNVLGNWETYLGMVVTVAVLIVYAIRLSRASRPRRRALVAVAVSSLLFLPVFFIYHSSGVIFTLNSGALLTMSWVLVAMRIVLPLGFLAALFQADLFAGVARGSLLEQLVTRPSPEQWRDAIAGALDDPKLDLAYWDPGSGCFLKPDGSELTPPPDRSDRKWIPVDRDHRSIATMVIDGALAEDPELVQAAASATVLAVENGNLEGAARDSEVRILAAGQEERRRIERDIHDGTQQRLVALRIHLSLASEQLDGPEQRALVERLGTEVDDAIDELRNIAAGVHPALLKEHGVAVALRSVSRHAGIPVSIEARGLRRYPETVELAVYYSCLEALQNAAKHAGPGATVTVSLSEDDGSMRFTIADDGVGFDPQSVTRGAGLANIVDRISALGGAARIESATGAGTRVRGQVPARTLPIDPLPGR